MNRLVSSIVVARRRSFVVLALVSLWPLQICAQCDPGQPSGRPVIMVTGYWPPTSTMLIPFSPCFGSPWVGSDWNGSGYDVYGFFPEFSPGCFPGIPCAGCGPGQPGSDFRVDYEDTQASFLALTATLNPVAILTTSWKPGAVPNWEIENRYYNNPASHWFPDCEGPSLPSPVPPDPTLPPFFARTSTLPNEAIETAVDALPGINAFICNTAVPSPSSYLSAYIAYLGVSYEAESEACLAAGHVHVTEVVSVASAEAALAVTLEALITHLENPSGTFLRGDTNEDGVIDIADAIAILSALFGGGAVSLCDDASDSSDDGVLDIGDAIATLDVLFGSSVQLAPPSGSCGLDSTPDSLHCLAYACP